VLRDIFCPVRYETHANSDIRYNEQYIGAAADVRGCPWTPHCVLNWSKMKSEFIDSLLCARM